MADTGEKESKPQNQAGEEGEVDPYWSDALHDHQAAALLGFASQMVKDGDRDVATLIAKSNANRELLVLARAKGEESAAHLAQSAITHAARAEMMDLATEWKLAAELVAVAITRFDEGGAENGTWN